MDKDSEMPGYCICGSIESVLSASCQKIKLTDAVQWETSTFATPRLCTNTKQACAYSNKENAQMPFTSC